jgi:hypothetical protein
MSRPDGAHSGNPAVRESVKNKDKQHVAWACERADGGRGFGFTGGHYHQGWANNDQRKLVLNAILWTAKAKIPAERALACDAYPLHVGVKRVQKEVALRGDERRRDPQDSRSGAIEPRVAEPCERWRCRIRPPPAR